MKAATKKVFSNEIQDEKLHYFVNDFDKTREDAYRELIESNKYLKEWVEDSGLEELSVYDLAVEYMERKISTHKFYETKIAPDGTPYSIHKSNKIEHPISLDDRGCRYMTLLLIPRNAFLQEIR
ncbi:hypothetical protein ACWGJQ_21220 [Peribacillus simplex]